MSSIRSLSVGNGDMYYINHGNETLTIIDCCLSEETKDRILAEISAVCAKKEITRFISTHPDEDHIRGLHLLDDKIKIANFYCVKNEATKEDETDSFTRYCELRDSQKAFYLEKGRTRKWMTHGDEDRGGAGISVLWPKVENAYFKDELAYSKEGGTPNNISAVIQYHLKGGVTALWMGDLETEFMEAVEDDLELTPVDILFAPHHGRASARVPQSMLDKLTPKIIVIGEAPAQHIHYYPDYNTITQNRAGDIHFECREGKVHIFTSSDYWVDFLVDENWTLPGFNYIGTLNL
jgi:beta-lactamase superfamily II metal-dependent hydrolase